MGPILTYLLTWFGPVAGALKGEINFTELLKVVTASVVSGGLTVASFWATLAAIGADSGHIFNTTAIAGVVATVISAVISLFHRTAQGK